MNSWMVVCGCQWWLRQEQTALRWSTLSDDYSYMRSTTSYLFMIKIYWVSQCMINAAMQTAPHWFTMNDDDSYREFTTGSIFLVNMVLSIPIYDQLSMEWSKTRDKNMIISKRQLYWHFIFFNRSYKINLINLLQKVVNIKRQWKLMNEFWRWK